MGFRKLHGGARVHFYADLPTVKNLDWLAENFYMGNRSQCVRDIIGSAVEQRMKAGKRSPARRSRTR